VYPAISGSAKNVQVMLDCTNITAASQRQYYENATYTDYSPGRTYMVGVRARF
jgi:hypothetical protein